MSLFSRLAHTFAFVTPSLVSNLDRHPVFFQSFSHFERAPTTKVCLDFAGNLDCKGKLSWRVEGGGGNMAAAMVAATGACVGLLGVSEMSVSSSSSRAAAPSSLLVSWLTQ